MIDDTITSMAKAEWLQIRISTRVKTALEAAAKRDHRTMSNYVLAALAKSDPEIAKALELEQ